MPLKHNAQIVLDSASVQLLFLFVFFVLIILFAKVASVANISLNSWQIVVNFALQSLKIVLSVLNKNVLFVQQECTMKLLQVIASVLKDSSCQVFALLSLAVSMFYSPQVDLKYVLSATLLHLSRNPSMEYVSVKKDSWKMEFVFKIKDVHHPLFYKLDKFCANFVILLQVFNSKWTNMENASVFRNYNFQDKYVFKFVEMDFTWWHTNVMMEIWSMVMVALHSAQSKPIIDVKMEAEQVLPFAIILELLYPCLSTQSKRMKKKIRESFDSMYFLLCSP